MFINQLSSGQKNGLSVVFSNKSILNVYKLETCTAFKRCLFHIIARESFFFAMNKISNESLKRCFLITFYFSNQFQFTIVIQPLEIFNDSLVSTESTFRAIIKRMKKYDCWSQMFNKHINILFD